MWQPGCAWLLFAARLFATAPSAKKRPDARPAAGRSATAAIARTLSLLLPFGLFSAAGLAVLAGVFALAFVCSKLFIGWCQARRPLLRQQAPQLGGRFHWAVFFAVGGVCLLFLLLLWRLCYFPFMDTLDTQSQWDQIHGLRPYSDLHALGHTLFLQLLLLIWDNYTIVVLAHLLMVAAVYGLFAELLCRKGVPYPAVLVGFGAMLCLQRVEMLMRPLEGPALRCYHCFGHLVYFTQL